MNINWVAIGWVIDMIFNGVVWLIIAVFCVPLIELTDKWTRKAIKYMDVVDKWVKKFVENSFEWIEKKNLGILFAFLFIILFGVLSQLGIIPKLIS